MKLLLASLLLALGSFLAGAQTGTLTANGLGESATLTITVLPKSTDTFSVSTASLTGVAGGTVTFNVSAATSRLMPAAVQFSLSAPSSSVSAFSATAGPVAITAGKSISCAVPTNPAPPAGTTFVNCIVSGLNQNAMANGVVALVTATLPGAALNGNITLGNVASSSGIGNAITASISGTGAIALAVNATLAVTCTQDANTLTPTANQVEPGEQIACQATLSAAQPTATVITLASSAATSPGFTVPASVTIAAGVLGIGFQITGI